jgi:hypothetical protein
MLVSPEDFLHAACAGQLSAAAGPLTVQPTTPQQLPALQKLVESAEFKAKMAQWMQNTAQVPALVLSPEVLAALPSQNLAALLPNPAALASALAWKSTLQSSSQGSVAADAPPKTTVAAPQPAAVAPQYFAPATGNIAGQTAFVHVTTAEELWAILGKKKEPEPVDPARVAIGASAGAAIGLGAALVKQSVGAVHPAAGAVLDLGLILIGAGVGAGIGGKLWQLVYNADKNTYSLAPA